MITDVFGVRAHLNCVIKYLINCFSETTVLHLTPAKEKDRTYFIDKEVSF